MKSMKRCLALMLAVLLMVSAFAGCGKSNQPAKEEAPAQQPAQESAAAPKEETAAAHEEAATRVITDMYGREVEIPTTINSIICTGGMCLRFVSYLQLQDKLVGIEKMELNSLGTVKRDYAFPIQDVIKDLPAIAEGGGASYKAFPEEIIRVNPDVILTTYQPDAVEQLAKETGLPVVAVSWDIAHNTSENLFKSLRFLAELFDCQERCDEVIDYVTKCEEDLNNRTKDIPDSEKKTVYTGAVTFSGGHGLAGTSANFYPFTAVNALNVADQTGQTSTFEVDLEKVLEWDPDVIFLDPSNMNLVNEEYANNPAFFQSLKAVQNGDVYSMISFITYSMNMTYCIMDAYYVGTVLFPEQFSDVDLEQISRETMTVMHGVDFYDQLGENGLAFEPLTIGA